jgi:hypothetical protein
MIDYLTITYLPASLAGVNMLNLRKSSDDRCYLPCKDSICANWNMMDPFFLNESYVLWARSQKFWFILPSIIACKQLNNNIFTKQLSVLHRYSATSHAECLY